MTWYAAHLIEYFKAVEGDQDSYLCFENVVLIDADNADLAYEEAERLGRFNAETQNTGGLWLEKEGQPPRSAQAVFAGVRKLMECQRVPPKIPPDVPAEVPYLLSGSEATYSRFVVEDERAVLALAEGSPVTVLYEE